MESRAEMYLHIANQYERLESSLEMASNQLLFIENTIDQDTMALSKIKEFETHMNDIKDSTPVLIPAYVRQMYPAISYINIFLFIKKMEIYKKNLIIKFKDIKNEINYILYKWAIHPLDETTHTTEKLRLDYLYKAKDKIKDELIQYKYAYNYIDDIFTLEIKQAESNKLLWFLYRPVKPTFEKCNPVIDKYLKFLFAD